jgi:hypothetical protein
MLKLGLEALNSLLYVEVVVQLEERRNTTSRHMRELGIHIMSQGIGTHFDKGMAFRRHYVLVGCFVRRKEIYASGEFMGALCKWGWRIYSRM